MAKQYWLYDSTGNFTETHLYIEQPENSTDIRPESYLCFPQWTGTEWVEGATPEQQYIEALRIETNKMKRRISDGIKAVAQMTAEYNLAVKQGLVTTEENLASHNALKSVRDEIINGCWDKALYQLESVDVNTVGQQLYDRIESQITAYLNSPNY